MTDPKTPPEKPTEKPAEMHQETRPHRATTKGHRDQRAEALEKALRENLRRRKAAVAVQPEPAKSNHEKASENTPDES